MNRQFGIVACVAAALVCGLAFSQSPAAQDPLPTKVEKLEKELAASHLRVEALSTEVADLKKQFTATLAYFDEQAKAAAAMTTVLDESEKAGFTYGLNPDSRHILLRGWRDQLATAQKDVPVAEAPAAPPVPAKAPARSDAKSQKAPAKSGT
jgi:peptidoglycan hydrolase CwlO-like protein